MSDLSLCAGHLHATICEHCRRRTEQSSGVWQSRIVPPELNADGTDCPMYVEPRIALLERSSVWGRCA